MKYPPYPAYKSSGVEWLGEMPKHWEVKRLKFLTKEPLQYGANEAAEEASPDSPRFVRITDITKGGELREETFRSLPYDLAKPYLLKAGDLLFARSGATVGKSFMYKESWGICCYAGYLIRFHPDAMQSLPEFLNYFVSSKGYWDWISSSLIQATIQNVSAEKYSNLLLPLPPLSEQSCITNFLDRETAKLDTLIGKQQELIEKLKAKRTVLISRTVTRGLPPDAAARFGLNPNPELKASGIEWIGEVPEHWGKVQLRRLTTFITSGSRGWAEHYTDSGAIFVRIGNLTRDSTRVDLSDIQHVDPPPGEEGERTAIQAGDLLFSITAYLGSIAVAPDILEGAYINQHIALVRLKQEELAPHYAAYSALSETGQLQLNSSSYGGTKVQLSLDDVKSLWLPFPPLVEQHAIANFLDRETEKIDRLIEKVQEAIAKLRTYRTSLITAAVTGKIDVRETTS